MSIKSHNKKINNKKSKLSSLYDQIDDLKSETYNLRTEIEARDYHLSEFHKFLAEYLSHLEYDNIYKNFNKIFKHRKRCCY